MNALTPTVRPASLRRALTAALCLLAGLGALFASAASAKSRAASVKPTIVLVHGAWADGSSWNRVVPRLQHAGYTVDVEANPLRGLASDSAYLAAVLHSITGPIILVGHSYGGAVITDAATGNTNVKGLVYIDAFVPAEGESVLQLASAQPGSCLAGNPANTFDVVPYPGALMGDVDLYLKQSLFHDCFANDLPASKSAVLAASQRPLTLSAASAKSTAPAWTTIPSWYLVGTADHVLPPAEQLFMAKRAHSHIVRVHASHLSMLSHPRKAADLIITAARATG